ncbi:anthranilate phosphoribosyltransferase [sulfur-oxidizing endosymbiont of Gigantopelta aegis]|uniref:anthranilate phosphoribosyltransferase n=1 Tax=sulfur-oxidizing endosymbiont of Gigantopelta aegis TaxID=2794934 RepID=UPI0018DCD4DC|nr:anthranilate phosphoribosyltransferase [sulfur-oxidizing endosymbiont of Gigantopelta aegis]
MNKNMTDQQNKMHLRSCIQRVCTGPEYSKNLPYDDAKAAMDYILSGNADPVQISILLVGLRMKRETQEENKGLLQAIVDRSTITTVAVNDLIDIADAYNGHVRDLPVIPFLPAVLAACGLPAASHGVESVGPKFGITTNLVLKATGLSAELSMKEAAQRIADPAIGWAYVDQKTYCPTLHDLIPLRTTIVKRTAITTLECLVGPLRGTKKTTLYTGFVHKAYPPVYTDLAKMVGFDGAIIARGVEGGLIPSLQQPAKVHFYEDDGEDQMFVVNATEDLGMNHKTRSTPLPKDIEIYDAPEAEDKPSFDLDAAVKATVKAGLAALNGEQSSSRDSLILAASIALFRTGKAESLSAGADIARQAIDSGEALKRFNA